MTKNYTIKDILDKIKKNKRWPDTKLVQKAYNYALKKHEGQVRKSGEPYIVHPTNVAYIIAELGLDEHTVCAALLHDVLEDTETSFENLVQEFGQEIAEMVDGVTKLIKIQYATIEENQVENYRKMFLAMGKDIRVIIIKLADRLHNMRTLKYLKEERKIAISQETMQLYSPLANRLGLYAIKWELEDLAFQYLYPNEFEELVKGIEQKREERLKFIEKIINDIKVQLKKQHIDAEVTGRAKHLYSIYRKMQRDSKTLDQIYDLFALRIIVNSVKDCYAALGVVHEMYNPMPKRFKDYIAVPKTNMYQSIHTTLLGEKGTPFEVQIRTWDMHKIAEYGIAAHWAYKEVNYGSKKGQRVVNVQEDKLAWLRETLEWQQEMQDPQEFLETLKTELFEDEVYVFTPKGEIKVLPRGATPIDFAYAIHAEVGNHMTGAKINSKMVPIITPIKNGDIVEIITTENSKGPSLDWLKFVKSTSAKNKITSWHKKERKTENIEKGKESIEREIKRIKIDYTDLFRNEYIDPMLERYKFKALEEMYAAIGFGAITATKVIARMLIEYRKEHKDKEAKIEEKIEELAQSKEKTIKPSNTGIVVKGIDNCLVKLSKCCNPLPGDEIIGYITKGRGVSVHRKDCVNINDLLKEENRIIEVKWYDQEKVSYMVEIIVSANDRNGLLGDMLYKINEFKARILTVNAKASKEKIVTTEIALEVDSLESLNKIMRELKKVDSVYDVKRKK
ncbi:MAG: bifunctional (p)ppGpp synthetase/guanosine-3',5'-bis(diphosphate) 3'-pyrophosphohydrolase [Clostridia bacterium]|nr:bifunctional (p)ppGpp synthetase/guanosine-3',5'-bis(diphosphate) 3'-pyrophosphohydrolase [Clostridia bacterium]